MYQIDSINVCRDFWKSAYALGTSRANRLITQFKSGAALPTKVVPLRERQFHNQCVSFWNDHFSKQ